MKGKTADISAGSHGPNLPASMTAFGSFFGLACFLHKKSEQAWACSDLVEEDGFEPSKSVTTDLQSAPFGRSGTPPYSVLSCGGGAGGRIRTPDLLITNQLLYRLSYTSVSAATILLYHPAGAKSTPKSALFCGKTKRQPARGGGLPFLCPTAHAQPSICSSR